MAVARLSFALLILLVLLPLLLAPLPADAAAKKEKKPNPSAKKNNKSKPGAKKNVPAPKKKKKKSPACARCSRGDCAAGHACRNAVCVRIRLQPVGATCRPTCLACARGARCTRGRCEAIAASKAGRGRCGARCSKDANCANGFWCVSGRCKKTMQRGAKCTDPCWNCAKGLTCRGGTCEKPPVAKCGACKETTDCEHGLVCKKGKPGQGGTCAMPMPAGGKCADRCWGCKKGLLCKEGRCQKPSPCTKCRKDSECEQGRVCKKDATGDGRCAKAMLEGGKCTDPCWGCAKGLECQDGVCKKKKVGKCGPCESTADCLKELVCRKGANGKGTCAKPMPKGGKCSDPCWGCAKGLVCRNGKVCDDPPQGWCGPCEKTGDCTLGLVCKVDAKSGKGKCAKPMKLDGKCGDPCWGCEPGLVCNDSNVCGKPKGEWCARCEEKDDCLDGLVCKKEFGFDAGKCAQPMGIGKPCDDPCWGCNPGLECTRVKGGRRVCAKPRKPVCGECSADDECKKGLTCKRGVDGKGKCAKVKPMGGSCRDPCWACAKGLTCVDGKTCLPPKVKLCQVCEKTSDCEAGLVCKKNKFGWGKCAKLMGIGHRCEHDCWGCKSGLVCGDDNKCREPPKKQCEPCEETHECATGLQCKKGTSGKGKCSRPMDIGFGCDDSCFSCKEGLVCRENKKCGKPPEKKCGPCGNDYDCVDGLVCKKHADGRGQCAQPHGPGEKCSDDCWTCKSGLICKDGKICAEPPSKKCGPCKADDDCVKGLACKIDKGGKGKCAKVVGVGDKCSDPCWKCGPKLVCKDGKTCTSPPSPKCGPCNSNGDCIKGLACKTGADGKGRCAQVLDVGGRCSDACGKCRPNLVCKDGKKCATPPSPKCGPCKTNGNCMAGLACKIGAGGKGRCAEVLGVGGKCSDACGTCRFKLVCKDGKTCSNPPSPKCGPCKADGDCEGGLACKVGANGKGKCAQVLSVGGKCSDTCGKCSPDLVCKGGTCAVKGKKCEFCNVDEECESGLTCKINALGRGRCAMVNGPGMKCNDPCWACMSGLVCNGLVCETK